MIVNSEVLVQARNRWNRRHTDSSRFEENVEFLTRAKCVSDITHPASPPPWAALHHNSATGLYDIIAEGDTVLTFRVVRAGPDHIEIEVINHDRVKELIRSYLARRTSQAPRSDAETAVENSANVVAFAAGAAGTVAVVRNIVGIVKDSLDIRSHFRERASKPKNGD